jgi:hypothetical protein
MLRLEMKDVHRFADRFAADQIDDDAHLAR